MIDKVLYAFPVYVPNEYIDLFVGSFNDFIDGDLLVVDQCPTEQDSENLRELLKGMKPDRLTILKVKTDRFLDTFNAMLTFGKEHGYDLVVICNFDILFMCPEFEARIKNIMDKDPNIGILCPMTNFTAFDYLRIDMPSDPNEALDWCENRKEKTRTKPMFSGDYICMAVNIRMVDLVGLWDSKNFGRYGAFAELDYGYRMNQYGYYWAATDDVLVYHFGGKARGGTNEARVNDNKECKANLYKKYGSEAASAMIESGRKGAWT